MMKCFKKFGKSGIAIFVESFFEDLKDAYLSVDHDTLLVRDVTAWCDNLILENILINL